MQTNSRHLRRSVPGDPNPAGGSFGDFPAAVSGGPRRQPQPRPASCWTGRAFRCCITCWSGPASSIPSSSTRSSSTRVARRCFTAVHRRDHRRADPSRPPGRTPARFRCQPAQSGGFVREPIPRWGSRQRRPPATAIRGSFSAWRPTRFSLSYWDYQLRLDGGNARNGWTVFFGAKDELDTPAATSPPAAPIRRSRRRLILELQSSRPARLPRQRRVRRTVPGGPRLRPHLQPGANVATWVLEPSMRWTFRPV